MSEEEEKLFNELCIKGQKFLIKLLNSGTIFSIAYKMARDAHIAAAMVRFDDW